MKQTKFEPTQEEFEYLIDLGWIPFGGWQFFKSGKVYDLSAANLEELDRIEKESLFIVAA